jgi:3-deoxy-D-manno-octulosonic-acid transferase
MQRLALAAYSLLMRLALPALLLRLWWRGRAEPLYRVALGERLGRYAKARLNNTPRADTPGLAGSPRWLWVHAVSLGETRAVAPLIGALRVKRPGLHLLLTHGTATGRDAGTALLMAGDQQVWLPFDTPGAATRFLRHFRPAVGVMVETEVWPNLMAAAERERVPMVLANARLSERSARRGQRLAALMRPTAARLGLVLAQTQPDADRLIEAGAPNVSVCGNLKFDLTPDAALTARGGLWTHESRRGVVLAMSTREGEESMLLDAWRRFNAPRPLLVIVPRHPQRFDDVAALIESAGFTVSRRSSWIDDSAPPTATYDVWLGDSIGEMAAYCASAQVALLGGSFAPLGGQNLIEAAACGCPVVMGPHTFNFADVAERALAEGAAQRVANMADGVALAVEITTAGESAARLLIGRVQATAFARRHRGAARRMADEILALVR